MILRRHIPTNKNQELCKYLVVCSFLFSKNQIILAEAGIYNILYQAKLGSSLEFDLHWF